MGTTSICPKSWQLAWLIVNPDREIKEVENNLLSVEDYQKKRMIIDEDVIPMIDFLMSTPNDQLDQIIHRSKNIIIPDMASRITKICIVGSQKDNAPENENSK